MGKRKKLLKSQTIDFSSIAEIIGSLKGIKSAKLQTDGPKIKEIHLLTDLNSFKAVKTVRTAIYARTGYLVDNKTIFKVARIK